MGNPFPARWSKEVLEVIEPILKDFQLPVHDPFAGTGERLGSLCDQLGLEFTGTEIEQEFIKDSRVIVGDSTDPKTYPCDDYKFIVVTSPVYPSGMADHFYAQDQSKRHTYRQALATILGYDRPLHTNNLGRWSVRRGKKSETQYWDLASKCVLWWPENVVINVSNFITAGDIYNLVGGWESLLQEEYEIVVESQVETPRLPHGKNYEKRVDYESILVATNKWL